MALRQTANLQQWFADRDLLFWVELFDVAANHHLDDARAGCFGDWQRGDQLAVTQNRDAINQIKHFVEIVRDIDDRDTVIAQRANDAEQKLGLAIAQGRRGLIQDEDARLANERSCNGGLFALCHA